MKRKGILNVIFSATCILLVSAYAAGQNSDLCVTGEPACYFAIEINGIHNNYTAFSADETERILHESNDPDLRLSL